MTNAAEVFETERPRLLGLAYRSLGVMSDAEDIVQEGWLRLQRQGIDTLDNPAAWLTTVTTRLAIDRLRSRQRSQETYIGPWLPEPIATTDDPTRGVELAESLTSGFLVLLETLGPDERVAFLLVDVFKEPYVSVAAMLDRTEASCRQLVHRARTHLEDGRPRFKTEPAEAANVAAAFATATATGDIEGLIALMSPDVLFVSDGGALQRAARYPITQPIQIARILTQRFLTLPANTEYEAVTVNGEPSMVLRVDGNIVTTMQLDITANHIRRIRLVLNQQKLTHLDEPVSVL